MTDQKNRDIYGVKHFEVWQPWAQLHPNMRNITIEMVSDNMITLPRVMETAISIINGTQVVDQVSCDLSDGSDAKFSTARFRNNRRAYSANIKGFKNKKGLLRIQVYNPIRDMFYWFCIPHEIYSQVKEIEIPFHLTGEPYKNKNRKHINFCWWEYQVNSFFEMAAEPANGKCEPEKLKVYKEFFTD